MNKSVYTFTDEVKNLVAPFSDYLKLQQLNHNTIRQKSNYVGFYLSWLETQHLGAEDTRYNDLLTFIDNLTSEGKTKHHINTILREVRDYYEFLKRSSPQINNPAKNLHLKGIPRKVITGVIPHKELETLYHQHPSEVPKAKRNKIILGLLVYQGITTQELHQLEVNHLGLKHQMP